MLENIIFILTRTVALIFDLAAALIIGVAALSVGIISRLIWRHK